MEAGQAVCFMRADDVWVVDKVIALTVVDELLEPYARNRAVPAVVLTRHSWTPQAGVRAAGSWAVLWAAEKDTDYADPPWTVHAVVFRDQLEAAQHVQTLTGAGRHARMCRPPDAAAFADVARNGVWVGTEAEARGNLNRAFWRLL